VNGIGGMITDRE